MVFDEQTRSCFRKFVGVTINIFGIMETAVVNFKGSLQLPKLMQIITESIKINNSRAPSGTFCGGLEFGRFWDPRH